MPYSLGLMVENAVALQLRNPQSLPAAQQAIAIRNSHIQYQTSNIPHPTSHISSYLYATFF
jgi:hypothetical protein